MKGEPFTVWTFGHSTRSIESFSNVLKHFSIETLADVRRFPGSHRNPQFNRELLSRHLVDVGIEYLAFPELGGRRPPRPDSRNTALKDPGFRGYADYMETEAFREGLARLLVTARNRRTAVMCAEAAHASLLLNPLSRKIPLFAPAQRRIIKLSIFLILTSSMDLGLAAVMLLECLHLKGI